MLPSPIPGPLEHAAALHQAARWRWLNVPVLLATIPAFYIELVDVKAHWAADALYALAALTLLGAQWRQAVQHVDRLAYLSRQHLDMLLVPGLLLAAALPASADSRAALVWRFAVALLTLIRLIGLLRPWAEKGSLWHVLMLCVGILGSCGIGFWWLEPRTPHLSDGLWLAFTTAATVGYGDVVPSTTASKIFAFFVVLIGYAALSLVTAAIAARWIESSERELERDILREMHREMRALRQDIQQLRERVAGAEPPP